MTTARNECVGGYLVVLAATGTQFGPRRNPQYRGIYRMPMWPSRMAQENPILERYVFEATDDSGFIPELGTARAIFKDLSRVSSREFEVIHCLAVEQCGGEALPATSEQLGYDVVPVGGDFLSIVGCPPEDHRLAPFLTRLNGNGLFDDCRSASEFLEEYVTLRLPEWDVPRRVFRVRLIDASN